MKSFTSSSFAGQQADALTLARAAVERNPQALFTDFQWFLYKGKDTVFFTAFSTESYDKDRLGNMVAEMIALAPQLTHGFVGAQPGLPFPKHLLDAITHVEEVDEFDGYPDKWISKSPDMFERDDLPLFRVSAAVRRGGPDAQGRASMIQVFGYPNVVLGAVVAAVVAAVCVRYFAQLLVRHGLNFFAWYRILLAIALSTYYFR